MRGGQRRKRGEGAWEGKGFKREGGEGGVRRASLMFWGLGGEKRFVGDGGGGSLGKKNKPQSHTKGTELSAVPPSLTHVVTYAHSVSLTPIIRTGILTYCYEFRSQFEGGAPNVLPCCSQPRQHFLWG